MSNSLGLVSEDSFNSKLTTLNNALSDINDVLNIISGGNLQPGNVTLSTNTVTLTYNSPTATVKLSNITGEPTIVVIGNSFNATLENGTITITKTDIWSETGTIAIFIKENGIYTSVLTFITVIVDDVEIGTWSNGTDKQIGSMIRAAHRGKLNLKDYWSVGDERVVNNIKYILDDGIEYTDINNSTSLSSFRVVYDLGLQSGIVVPFCSNQYSSGQVDTYYSPYFNPPSNNYLNDYKLYFYFKRNYIGFSSSTSPYRTYLDRTTKNWYGKKSDLSLFNLTNSGNYINCEDLITDPSSSSSIKVGSQSINIIINTMYTNNGTSYTSTITEKRSAYNYSSSYTLTNNLGIIGYFLI